MRLLRRHRHDQPPGELAEGASGIAWRARHPGRLRSQDRDRNGRDAGRQHRLGIHDELHGDKAYGSRCLISEATATMCAADFELREIDRVMVVGQSQPQTVYDVMGRNDALTPQQTLLRERYAAGLAAYRAQRWDEARAAFTEALKAASDDGPSISLLARVADFERNP